MPAYLAAVSPFSVRNIAVRQSKKFVGMPTFSSLQAQGWQFLIRAGKNTESRAQGVSQLVLIAGFPQLPLGQTCRVPNCLSLPGRNG